MTEVGTVYLAPMDEWDALISEGHCIQCRGRLRPLTAAEQRVADGWFAVPVGICEADNAIVGRYRSGQPFVSWPPAGEKPFGGQETPE